MNMIRTEQQAVLDQLCQTLQESADHYRETADIFADEEAAFLAAIAVERDQIAEHIATALRQLDVLPSAPDRDRETLASLMDKLRALVPGDNASRILVRHLHGEQHLARLASDAHGENLDAQCNAVVDEAMDHIQKVTTDLQKMLSRLKKRHRD